MKFLNCPGLAHITSLLTAVPAESGIVFGKVEAYSLKQTREDRKFAKSVEQQIVLDLSKTPPSKSIGSSFGTLNSIANRKALIDLISTMNQSFPEYEFSNLRDTNFIREKHLELLQNQINLTLNSVIENYFPQQAELLWTEIDAQIKLQECEIYEYIPSFDNHDPFNEPGVMWSFNYFFRNPRLRRILFFTCKSVSPSAISDDDGLAAEMEMEMEMENNGFVQNAQSKMQFGDDEIFTFDENYF